MRKDDALISLCLFMFYFTVSRVARLSTALKIFVYILQQLTIWYRCVCKCACVSDLLLESHSFQRTGLESVAINLHHLPLLYFHSSHSPRFPSSSLFQSSVEPGPFWNSDPDSIIMPVTSHTHTHKYKKHTGVYS